MTYGCYIYYFQGQYSYQISYQGVSMYAFQTAGNLISFCSGLIAAALFGNIGIKVLYNNVLMDLFSAPPLTTRPGKIIYGIIVPIWWSIAYVLAAAIPDYFGFASVISSAVGLEFTYCFPPMLALAYDIQLNAMTEGEGFDPQTGVLARKDRGLKRWARGFRRGKWWLNVLHVLYALGAWATAGLGLYAAIKGTSLDNACKVLPSGSGEKILANSMTGMILAFENPQLNSFTCTSPLNLNV